MHAQTLNVRTTTAVWQTHRPLTHLRDDGKVLAPWRTVCPEATPVCCEYGRDVQCLGGGHQARVREVHRELCVLIHQTGCSAMAGRVQSNDRDLRGKQKFQRFARWRATAKHEVTCLGHNCLDSEATLDERGPAFDTWCMPLIARVENGDEWPRIEQDVARSHDERTLVAPVVRAHLFREGVMLDRRGIERERADHLADALPGAPLGGRRRTEVRLERLADEQRFGNGPLSRPLGEGPRQGAGQAKRYLIVFHAVHYNAFALHQASMLAYAALRASVFVCPNPSRGIAPHPPSRRSRRQNAFSRKKSVNCR